MPDSSYQNIFKAFVNYCYENVESHTWKKYYQKDFGLVMYSTEIESLEVTVGMNVQEDEYFFTVKHMGVVGTKNHRGVFPSKLQRLYYTINYLETE